MTRSQDPKPESLESIARENGKPTSSKETLRSEDRADVEKRSMLQKIFIDAPVAVVTAPFKWMGRHPILTTIGAAALAYFAAPTLFGYYAGNEAAGARAGVNWWSRFAGALPRGPGMSQAGSIGRGLGGGYGGASGSL